MVSKMTFDKVADALASHLAAHERQENAPASCCSSFSVGRRPMKNDSPRRYG